MRSSIAMLLLAGCGRIAFDDARDATPDADVGMAVGCDPLPPSAGPTVTVTTASELVAAVNAATPGQTILLADGMYTLTQPLGITTPDVTLRSAADDAGRVIIDGGGAVAPVMRVSASGTQLVSLTITRGASEAVMVTTDGVASVDGVLIYNVSFLDNRGTSLRVQPYLGSFTAPFADGGTIACSRFVVTQLAAAETCGVDGVYGLRINASRSWVVRDNFFSGVTCPSQFIRGAWINRGSRDIRIVNNVFIDNNDNLMLGGDAPGARTYADPLPTGCSGTPQLWGGVVCNNRIAGLGARPFATEADFQLGIGLWSACDTLVVHNTIVSPGGAETFSDLEVRFVDSYAHAINNLIGMAPVVRDGGTFATSQDALYGSTTEFVDAAQGDLHLTPTAPIASGVSIASLGECAADADGRARDLATPTPGAYER